MKKIAFAVVSALALAACATIPTTSSSAPHSHILPNTVSLGERHLHATMDYDPNYGEITINILDEKERPLRAFSAEKAKAVLVTSGREERQFYFANTDAEFAHVPSGSYRFFRDFYTNNVSVKADWLKGLSEFKLKTWLPLEGNTYEATFVYPAPASS
jgi:hypothetical protein